MIITKVMDNDPPKNTGLIDETIIIRLSIKDILDFIKQVVFSLLRFHCFGYVTVFNKDNGNTLLFTVFTGKLRQASELSLSACPEGEE